MLQVHLDVLGEKHGNGAAPIPSAGIHERANCAQLEKAAPEEKQHADSSGEDGRKRKNDRNKSGNESGTSHPLDANFHLFSGERTELCDNSLGTRGQAEFVGIEAVLRTLFGSDRIVSSVGQRHAPSHVRLVQQEDQTGNEADCPASTSSIQTAQVHQPNLFQALLQKTAKQ